METTTLSREAAELLALYRERGATATLAERFYLYMIDSDITHAAEVVDNSSDAGAFYDGLTALYCEWLDAMTDEERRYVFSINEAADWANRNYLLDEEAFDQYRTGGAS